MEVKQLISELATSVYAKRDKEKSKEIYNKILENNLLIEIEDDIYKLVPVISYYILINDVDNLKKYVVFLENNSKKYSSYEKYFIYYFKAAYFFYNDHNSEAVLYALSLIDIAKLKKYIKYDYIELFIGMIYYLKGNAYLILKDFDNSTDNYLKGIKYFDKEESLPRKLVLYANVGVNHSHKGEYDEAIKVFYQIIEEYEGVIPYKIFYYTSVLEFLKGNYMKSKLYFDSIVLDVDDNSVSSIYSHNTYNYFGSLLHYFLNDYEKSKGMLSKVNMEVTYNKNLGYYYKVITALVNKDYSKKTVDEIKNVIKPYFEKNYSAGNLSVCEIYFEELQKNKH